MITKTILPSADGDQVANVTVFPASPTTRFDKVVSADDATSYLTLTSVGRCLFPHTPVAMLANNVITGVTVYYKHTKTSGTQSCNIRAALKVGDNYYDTVDGGVNPTRNTWTTSSYKFTTNPKTGVAWTPDDLVGKGANALQQFGVYSSDISPQPLVTQVYLEVTYTPPPVPSSAGYNVVSNAYVAQETSFAETEVGDVLEPEFLPQVKVKRWDNECNFSVRLVHDELTPALSTDAAGIKWSGDKVEAKFYDKGFTEGGAYEFEVVLKSKPTTNVVTMTLQTKGLDFFKQPDTFMGQPVPDDIAGSYAVYHPTQTGDYTALGGPNYKTGKFCHIYRPMIIDAIGAEVWGDLNIDTVNGLLTVTIPQEFLDSATYPVRHAAGLTFGLITKGGTPSATPAYFYGTKYQAPGNGNVSSMSVYIKNARATAINLNMGYYNDNAGAIGTHVNHGTAISVAAGFDDWKTINFTGSITNAAYYWLVRQLSAAVDCTSYLDAGSTNQIGYDSDYSFDTWGNSPTMDGYTNYKESIYAIYTAAIQNVSGVIASSTKATMGGLKLLFRFGASIVNATKLTMGALKLRFRLTGTVASGTNLLLNSIRLKIKFGGTITSTSKLIGALSGISRRLVSGAIACGTTLTVGALRLKVKLGGTVASTTKLALELLRLLFRFGGTVTSTTSVSMGNLRLLLKIGGAVASATSVVMGVLSQLGIRMISGIITCGTAVLENTLIRKFLGGIIICGTTAADIVAWLLGGTIACGTAVVAKLNLKIILSAAIACTTSLFTNVQRIGTEFLSGVVACGTAVTANLNLKIILGGAIACGSAVLGGLLKLVNLSGSILSTSAVIGAVTKYSTWLLSGTIACGTAVLGGIQQIGNKFLSGAIACGTYLFMGSIGGGGLGVLGRHFIGRWRCFYIKAKERLRIEP